MIKQEFIALESEVIALRRHFHQHPELGRQEHRTAQFIEAYLNALGMEVSRIYDTGVIALLRGDNPGKTLMLRADMDALPIEEELDVAYQSINKGVMHACGHDAHVAMLLGAAKLLADHRQELHGVVKFVFEPDEEGNISCGAEHLTELGVLENPKVDAVFALHIWSPLNNKLLGISPGAVFSEMYSFRIMLKGRSGHGSLPHEAVDPILCTSAVIQNIQAIQTREINLRDTTVITFGSIHGGNANNVIPERVELTGSMRCMYKGDDSGPQHPRIRFMRMVQSIAQAYQIEAKVEFERATYVVWNDADFVDFLKSQVLPQIVEPKNIVPYSTMASELFGEYTTHNKLPGALLFLGTGDHTLETDQPHHSSKFQIDESNLIVGVEIFVRTAMEFLK